MELFRVNSNPWGQEVLVGVSWDLLWAFIGAGALFIVAHLLFRRYWVPRLKNSPKPKP